MAKLEKDFRARAKWANNRSSAVFPIYFNNLDNDLLIVFFNYFKHKNNIKNIKAIFSLLDKNGKLVKKVSVSKFSDNNLVYGVDGQAPNGVQRNVEGVGY